MKTNSGRHFWFIRELQIRGFLAISTVTVVFAAATALGASDSEYVLKPVVIMAAEIDTGRVFVKPMDDGTGARLTIIFARKSRKQVAAIRRSKRPVALMDGDKLIAQAKVITMVIWAGPIDGFWVHGHERSEQYGLDLYFASVEEAESVAKAIHSERKAE